MKFVKSLYSKFRNLILYGIFGGISAGLDFVIYTLLVMFGTNYVVANIIGVHCGILTSFILNRNFNFRVKDKATTRFLSFYMVGLLGLVLSTSMLYAMVNWMQLSEIYSKLITIFVVAIIQFLINKYVTFKSNCKKSNI